MGCIRSQRCDRSELNGGTMNKGWKELGQVFFAGAVIGYRDRPMRVTNVTKSKDVWIVTAKGVRAPTSNSTSERRMFSRTFEFDIHNAPATRRARDCWVAKAMDDHVIQLHPLSALLGVLPDFTPQMQVGVQPAFKLPPRANISADLTQGVA